jgi:hypothetical protein
LEKILMQLGKFPLRQLQKNLRSRRELKIYSGLSLLWRLGFGDDFVVDLPVMAGGQNTKARLLGSKRF